MNNDLLKKLREFVEEWHQISITEGVKLQDIDVNLVSVLADISKMAGIDPRIIGLDVNL